MKTNKLTSRKFWLAIGGSAAGIATLISGFAVPDPGITLGLSIAGLALTAVSIVAYNFAEAYVDGKAAEANGEAVITTYASSTNVNANTTSAQTVERIIGKDTAQGPYETVKVGGTDGD